MAIEPGGMLSQYRLVEKIGEGGMGVVWKALDTTLQRHVAIKILPPQFTSDRDRLARFEREAKLLASLNHPGIAAIHGLHEADGERFLALELVDGEDLAQRLERGPLVLDEALSIAQQVAEALEAAHDSGIIHRDLKPANIKLTPSGRAKVLDFGLAKALADDGGAAAGSASLSPTITSAGTMAGVILGTAAYMSPEQAHGRTVDRRADVWSFGCVLFEMLTGAIAFRGESVSDTIAAVLRGDPEWNRLPSDLPIAVRRLLRRCLEKDPRYRLQAIGEARVALERRADEPPEEQPAAAPPRGVRFGTGGVLAIAAGLVIVALLSVLISRSLTPRPERRLRRFTIPVDRLGIDVGVSPLISPDGRRVVYSSGDALLVRDFDALEPRELIDSGRSRYVFWSPDSSQVAYIAGGKLWRVPATGGTPAAITTANISLGGSTPGGVWTEDDRILFAQSASGTGLLTVPAQGGDFSEFIKHDPQVEHDFHKPSLLPDGRGLLMIIDRVGTGADTIGLVTPAGERKTILQLEKERLDSPVYSPSGHILYQRDTTTPGIWAVPFSLAKLETTGPSFLVVADAIWPSVSADGTLLYVQARLSRESRLVLVDHAGKVTERHGDPGRALRYPAVSPDGTRVAYIAPDDNRQLDIYLYDFARGTRSRLTFTEEEEDRPCWAGNDWLVFERIAPGGPSVGSTIRARRADGMGDELELTDGAEPSVSADMTFLIFSRFMHSSDTADPAADLWWFPLSIDDATGILRPGEASLFVDMPRWQSTPLFAPDGRHVVYSSSGAGFADLFVRSFPDGDGPWQVSRGGGGSPRWSPEGDRLYYLKDDLVMEVTVQWQPRVAFGTPRVLFSTEEAGLNHRMRFDIAPDGQHLIMMENVTPSAAREDALTIVENWFAEFEAGE
jgi:serine/threonine-protein kinase